MGQTAEYILSNWKAAKLRLKGVEGALGSSTESYVICRLSDRMSSRPKGWSRKISEAASVLPEWGKHAKAGKVAEKRKAGRRERKRILKQCVDHSIRKKQAWGCGGISGEHNA